MTIVIHDGHCGVTDCPACKENAERHLRRYRVEVLNIDTLEWEITKPEATFQEVMVSSIADACFRLQPNDVFSGEKVMVTRIR